MSYAIYPEKFDHHMTKDTKRMLKELSEATNRSMSEIARSILESSIKRRYLKLKNKVKNT